MSEGVRCRPAFLGISGPSPMARDVHQHAWGIWTVPEGLVVEQLSRATRAGVREPPGQPAVPGESVPCPRARGVDQLSRAIRVQVRGPE
ncbi:hypothetical protein C0984_19740, partial [Clostridioides difficile]